MKQDRDVAESAKFRAFETEMPYADGKVHIEMAVKFPIPGPDGAVTAVGGISADITELKRAEAAARHNEARFREFFEKSHFVFLTLDPSARVTACNDHLLRLTGYESSEVIGCDWIDIFIPEDERTMIRRVFGESLNAGRSAKPVALRERHPDPRRRTAQDRLGQRAESWPDRE